VRILFVTSTRIAPGHARIHAGTAGMPGGHTGWRAASVLALVPATTQTSEV